MHQKTDIQMPTYYKLTTGEDVVAYELAVGDSHIKIKQPMAVFIENNFLVGKQLLNVREWIPPIITVADELELPKSLIMFSLACNESFALEFKDLVDYFYNVTPVKRKRARVKSENTEEGDQDRKVIPFMFKDDTGNTH